MFLGKETQQPGDVTAPGVPTGLGQLPHLGAIHPPHVREEQDPLVVRRGEQLGHLVVGAQAGSANSLATTLLQPVQVGTGAFGVPAAGDGDDDVIVGDEVLLGEVPVSGDDAGATLVTVLLDDLGQLVRDDLTLTVLTGEDRLVVGDEPFQLVEPVDDLLTLQGGQTTQLHVEDGAGLDLVDLQQLLQTQVRLLGVRGATDERDDLVEHVEGLDEGPLDVGVLLGLGQPVLGAPADDLHLVVDPVTDELVQPQGARNVVDQRQHVAAEGVLQARVLVEVVHDDARLGVTFEDDDEPLAGTRRGVVPNVGDTVDTTGVHQVGNLGGEVVGIAHVGQFGDDQALAPLLVLLHVDDGTHRHRAATGAIGVLDALTAHDEGTAGEVRSLDAFHGRLEQLLGGGVGMGQGPLHGLVDLTQVVGRDVGGHAHGDTRGTVDEQVRESGRQDDRLGLLVVVVGLEVDGVLVDVANHLHGQRRHLALGVSHGRGTVIALGPEVALALHQLVAHRPRLGQTHQGVIDGRVAVRMVFAHDVTNDTGALVPAAIGTVPTVVHGVDDATVHWFEAVSHVGEGSPDDDTHRVVEVGVLDLVTNLDRPDADVATGHQTLVVSRKLLVGAVVISHAESSIHENHSKEVDTRRSGVLRCRGTARPWHCAG